MALLLEELRAAEPASSEGEALGLMEVCIDRVEDAHSGVPKDPQSHEQLRADGRMYAPHPNFRRWDETLGLAIYRQRQHATYVAENGAFAIFTVPIRPTAVPVLSKRGADGGAFWDRPGWRDPPAG